MSADVPYENGRLCGTPPRHIDGVTSTLDRLARSWLVVQQTRKALDQQELADDLVKNFKLAEDSLGRKLKSVLRDHPLWPWLSQFPGLGGAHTAIVIGRIGDPRRFPGQQCSAGLHYFPPVLREGSPCPVSYEKKDSETGELRTEIENSAACLGVMLAPRTTSGVRSLWH